MGSQSRIENPPNARVDGRCQAGVSQLEALDSTFTSSIARCSALLDPPRSTVPHYRNRMHNLLLDLIPTRLRRRLFSSSIRRRLAAVCALVVVALVVFHETSSTGTPGRKPTINDRRILESDNVVAVAPVVDGATGKEKGIGAGDVRDEREINPKIIRPNSAEKEKSANSVVGEEGKEADGEVEGNEVREARPVTVVLVIAATRPAAIQNHLEQLIRLRPSANDFPIVVSQDGPLASVTSVIRTFVNESARISFIHHSERSGVGSQAQKTGKNYFFIAQHYKWALDKVFFEMNYTAAIITEDDLDIAEDFFSYFSATRSLLRSDSSIWCVSAWNDNGGRDITNRKQGEQLYRTDFFPGLGWMLTVDLWKELTKNWPEMYWDDWLRRQEVRSNRVCVRPEVSRTAHNNRVAGKGSSGGMYKTYLASITLPEAPVDFSLVDMSYLIKDNYDRRLLKRLREAKHVTVEEVEKLSFAHPENSHLVVYRTPREFRRIAKAVGLMVDIRSGMPRTAYYGVVPFMLKGSRVYAITEKMAAVLERDTLEDPSSDYYSDDWDKMARFLDFQETYCKPRKFTGRCDPQNPEMIEWFRAKRLSKRLASWGEMIVN